MSPCHRARGIQGLAFIVLMAAFGLPLASEAASSLLRPRLLAFRRCDAPAVPVALVAPVESVPERIEEPACQLAPGMLFPILMICR